MRVLPVIALIPPVGEPASGEDVVRHDTPGSDRPDSAAVEVAGGVPMVHLAGVVAHGATHDAPGDTRHQTRAVLSAIEATLRRLKLGLGDVIRMQVRLVGVPALQGRMDYEGFMAAFRERFGTRSQPRLPVRSVFQVAALADPDWLVQIEVSAARPRRAA
jgi:enamine deaminase RidA (YjgF/YER057c/UK114 family)